MVDQSSAEAGERRCLQDTVREVSLPNPAGSPSRSPIIPPFGIPCLNTLLEEEPNVLALSQGNHDFWLFPQRGSCLNRTNGRRPTAVVSKHPAVLSETSEETRSSPKRFRLRDFPANTLPNRTTSNSGDDVPSKRLTTPSSYPTTKPPDKENGRYLSVTGSSGTLALTFFHARCFKIASRCEALRSRAALDFALDFRLLA